jgi:hypothetical protein
VTSPSTDSFYVQVTDGDMLSDSDGNGQSDWTSVTVLAGDEPGPPLTNGSFAAGFTGWTTSGNTATNASGGQSGAWGGMTVVGSSLAGTSTISQSYVVPSASNGQLTVWQRVRSNEPTVSPARDTLEVRVTAGPTSVVKGTASNLSTRNVWTKYVYDLSEFRGKLVNLKFTGTGTPDGYWTAFDLDELSLS